MLQINHEISDEELDAFLAFQVLIKYIIKNMLTVNLPYNPYWMLLSLYLPTL